MDLSMEILRMFYVNNNSIEKRIQARGTFGGKKMVYVVFAKNRMGGDGHAEWVEASKVKEVVCN